MQNNLKGGDYKMTDKNVNFNSSSKGTTLSSTGENKFSSPDKLKSVEPLPESSRPRRDGPGGEDGD